MINIYIVLGVNLNMNLSQLDKIIGLFLSKLFQLFSPSTSKYYI